MATNNAPKVTMWYLPKDVDYVLWNVRSNHRRAASVVDTIKAGEIFFVSDMYESRNGEKWLKVVQIGMFFFCVYVHSLFCRYTSYSHTYRKPIVQWRMVQRHRRYTTSRWRSSRWRDCGNQLCTAEIFELRLLECSSLPEEYVSCH